MLTSKQLLKCTLLSISPEIEFENLFLYMRFSEIVLFLKKIGLTLFDFCSSNWCLNNLSLLISSADDQYVITIQWYDIIELSSFSVMRNEMWTWQIICFRYLHALLFQHWSREAAGEVLLGMSTDFFDRISIPLLYPKRWRKCLYLCYHTHAREIDTESELGSCNGSTWSISEPFVDCRWRLLW